MVFVTAELCVPHLPEQKPVTVTSFAVKTILTAFDDATFEASLTRWLSVNDFPREYFESDSCLPSRVDTEAGLFNLVWYFSVIFHHVATDGWACELYDLEDNEVMKSEIMAFWDGLKLPYHIRFTEMFPARRGPLWYSSKLDESRTNSVSLLVAIQTCEMDNRKTRCSRKRMGAIL